MGKILYLPVATLPPELPSDPLAGCGLHTDVSARRRPLHRPAGGPPPLIRGGFGATLIGAAYIAACVLWPAALWALPVCVTLGVSLYGSYHY